MSATTTETLSFQAETKQLMDLMIHSLYSHHEVFLRELISNASDALDKLRFQALSDSSLLPEGSELAIVLEIDPAARTLTIHDNGIGMSRQEVIEHIGTIAKSGTKELWQRVKDAKDKPEDLIGQFGVGFYSAFMVADKVTLITRRAGQDGAIKWESDGKGEYTLADAERIEQGTSITLHLRAEDKEKDLDDYADEYTIRQIVKKYSDFIRFPIKFKEDTLNSMKAIWKKKKDEVSDEEHAEFYSHISHDWLPPLKHVSVHAEGTLEYHALLYIPSQSPQDIFYQTHKWGPTLYVKNVRIMDDCEELLPRYLRFVKGVVDSSDLPLNVSREILQNHGQVRVLRKGITKKVLDALAELQKSDAASYLKFWKEFGPVLKEGVAAGFGTENKDKIIPLLMFHSSNAAGDGDSDERTTLEAYVGRMKEGQEEIYYLAGDSKAQIASSPHLEAFRKKGIEVLYLNDAIDEFVVQSLTEFDGKKLKSAAKGDIQLGDAAEKDKVKTELEDKAKQYAGVLLKLQTKLEKDIKEARLSSRLTDSAVCLVGGDDDISPHLARLLAQGNHQVPAQQRIMEINPDHPICLHMKALYSQNSSDPALEDYAELLYGLGQLSEGSMPHNPGQFTRLVADLMARVQAPAKV